jgi:hypothetical protein
MLSVRLSKGEAMKRWFIFISLVGVALALAAVGAADPGNGAGKGNVKQGHARFTFTFTNTDNGSCGATWATLLETRTYSVKDNGNGTFTLRRTDKGTFTTIAGQSPGACETGSNHGHLIRAGVTGRFVGYLLGTVTATAFNPKATCSDVDFCATREGFLQTYFTGATYSCDQNSADCKFNFNYTASNKGANQTPKLIYRHWQDRGKGAGTLLHEVFHGDIANS